MALLGQTTTTSVISEIFNQTQDYFYIGTEAYDAWPDSSSNKIFNVYMDSSGFPHNAFITPDSYFYPHGTPGMQVGMYLVISNEVMEITSIYPYNVYSLMKVEVTRGVMETTAVEHTGGELVQIWNSIPDIGTGFPHEETSTGFGVDGVTIEQTLLNPFDPYSGIEIDASTFQNTNQGLENFNLDGRIALGMFFFDDENQSSKNYFDVLRVNFKTIEKINLIQNGAGKYMYSVFKDPSTGNQRDFYLPQGGWGYCTYDGIEYRKRGLGRDASESLYTRGFFIESSESGLNHINSFEESSGTPNDNHGTIGYAGYYPYFFDYRIGLNSENFTTNKLEAIPLSGAYGEERIWGRSNTPLGDLTDEDSIIFDEALVFTRGDNDDDYDTYDGITAMKIGGIVDVDTSEAVVFEKNSPGRTYVKHNWNYNEDGDDYYNNFDTLITGKTYRFLFKEEGNSEAGFVPVVDSLIWPALLDISVEIQNSGILSEGDNSTPGAPLRLQQNLQHSIEQSETDVACNNFYFMNHYDSVTGMHSGDYTFVATELEGYSNQFLFTGPVTNMTMPKVKPLSNSEVSEVEFPNFAKWIISSEAYSYGKCLEFLAVNFDESVTNSEVDFIENGFDWGTIGFGWVESGGAINNQYRSLNQVIEFYRGGSDASPFLEPYSSIKVSFKMKTDSKFYNSTVGMPSIETAIVDSDGDIEDPSRTLDFTSYNEVNGAGEYGYDKKHVYWPNGGEFNSQTYNDNLHTDGTVDKRQSNYGSMGRFQNTEFDTWEEFSYTFTLGGNFLYNDSGNLKRLFFIVQAAGSNFMGRVLLDDFEITESYEFYLDCDVRKKLSTGQYGTADLTKYYDKEIEPKKYKDSQGPLEAQFYFYPTYPTDELFNVNRTPIYQDFKKGLFYIYDVDWGDGSPKEFVREPEQIDEEKALYHTYETSGIFEVTGVMLRKKIDSQGNELGVIHNKKFNLRININEGSAEDFDFFGSNGFSFIPYKNTTPIIGGISNQSLYYKSLKRQLGFIGDSKSFVKFKNKSDKLKTELALLKMENQSDSDLEVLPSYMIERFDDENTQDDTTKIYNGISPIKEELGQGIGDCDITNIKYYNTPKSIWEMLDFKEYDLNKIGNPDEERYWKNIIPKDYSIYSREGLKAKLIITMQGRQDSPTFNGYDVTLTTDNNSTGGGITWYHEELEINLNNIPSEITSIVQTGTNAVASRESIVVTTENGSLGGAYIAYGNWIISDSWDGPPVLETGRSYILDSVYPTVRDLWYISEYLNPNLPYYEELRNSGLFDMFDFETYTIDDPNLSGTHIFTWNPSISLSTDGTPDGTPPHYNIIVNGVTYYDGFITNSLDRFPELVGSSLDYNFNIPIDRTLDVQEIRIKYDNNGTPTVPAGQDRNLYVNSIKINNVKFDGNLSTHNDINVYYDAPDIYNYMENNPNQTTYNENGVSTSGAMAWDGNMVFEIPTSYFKTSIAIDTYSEQEWLGQNEYGNTYYYPVLPKYGSDGKFIDGNFSNNKIPFPIQGSITNEQEKNKNLLITITSEKTVNNIMYDKSGNSNLGFSISDYKPGFDNQTLKPLKRKTFNRIRNSKVNGAF